MTKTVEYPLCYIDFPKFGLRIKAWKASKATKGLGEVFRRYFSNSSATAPRWSAFTASSAVTGIASKSLRKRSGLSWDRTKEKSN